MRRKTHGHYIRNLDRSHIGTQQRLQYPVVVVQHTQHLAAEAPAFPDPTVVVPGPAVVTAEFLICPSVAYLVSAFKTDRYPPFNNLIFHTVHYFPQANLEGGSQISKRRNTVLLFPEKSFSFSLMHGFFKRRKEKTKSIRFRKITRGRPHKAGFTRIFWFTLPQPTERA